MRLIRYICLASVFSLQCAYALPDNQTMSWNMMFYDVQVNDEQSNLSQCIQHTPNVMQASIAELLQQEIDAGNGVKVKFTNYDVSSTLGLTFTKIHAQIAEGEGDEAWHGKMTIFAQKLSPNSQTHGVWSSGECKGRFEALPILSTMPKKPNSHEKESTAKPTDNSSTAKPTDNSSTAKPTDNSSTAKPD